MDDTARLWDAGTGNQIAVLEGHRGAVNSAAFSPDGSRIVTAVRSGIAWLWRAFSTTRAIIDYAKQIVPRCLTKEQLEQFYLPPEPPRWCITGAGLEAERDPERWQPKWPYQTEAWRDWLAARGRSQL